MPRMKISMTKMPDVVMPEATMLEMESHEVLGMGTGNSKRAEMSGSEGRRAWLDGHGVFVDFRPCRLSDLTFLSHYPLKFHIKAFQD